MDNIEKYRDSLRGFRLLLHHALSLLVILSIMVLLLKVRVLGEGGGEVSTLLLGFILLVAYNFGLVCYRIGLPKITGYLMAGLLFGPDLLAFISRPVLGDLEFINNLALAFIAFSAGGEIRLKAIRRRLKSITFQIVGVSLMVFTGVTTVVFLLSGIFPFFSNFTPLARFAIAAIFGVIAVARSPSSTIAVICETRAKGKYTSTVLSVTVATDVVIIILFALVVSVSQGLLSGGVRVGLGFLLQLLMEIGVAFLAGYLLGRMLIFLLINVRTEFPVVLAAMGFLVIKFSQLLGEYFHEVHDIGIHFEPLLICMVAGFTAQNFSPSGDLFLEKLEQLSLPIYVAFFTITGASINLSLLKTGWLLGVIMVLLRVFFMWSGSRFSAKLAGDEPIIARFAWLAFLTQAGVSLGLVMEVNRRFPAFGEMVASVLIAAITVNQILGPIALKYALHRAGETAEQREKEPDPSSTECSKPVQSDNLVL